MVPKEVFRGKNVYPHMRNKHAVIQLGNFNE